jgi:RHS repeat-associated protein
MERDEETGLICQTARYYAAWTATWVSADPAGVEAGSNQYRVCHCNPIRFSDPSGLDPDDSEETYKGVEVRKGLNNPAAAPKVDPNTASSMQRGLLNEPPPSYELSDFAHQMEIAAGYASQNEAALRDTSVGEPGLGESMIPIWGSGRSSVNQFQHGNYGLAAAYGALAVSDIFLIKSIATAPIKFLGARGGTAVLTEGLESVAPRLYGVESRAWLGGLARKPLGTVQAAVPYMFETLEPNVLGKLVRNPGIQVAPGYGSKFLANFGLADVSYDVNKLRMYLAAGLESNLPLLNSVIAHENYHVWFPLNFPRIAYIGDRGLPIMRVYARFGEELGAYYAGGTPLRGIASGAYSSTIGSGRRAAFRELEFWAPPAAGVAGATATATLAAGLGSYAFGRWYFSSPPPVLPPITLPPQPRD